MSGPLPNEHEDCDSRSPLTSIGTNNALNLKPWNDAMAPKSPASALRDYTPSKLPWRLTGSSQRTPVAHRIRKVPTPSWATRRVVAGSTPAKRPVQLASRFYETPLKDTWKATALTAFPNATQAEFWLRKARQLQANGKTQEARETLLGALSRDVQPATDITRAITQLEQGEMLDPSIQATQMAPKTGHRQEKKSVLWPSLQGSHPQRPSCGSKSPKNRRNHIYMPMRGHKHLLPQSAIKHPNGNAHAPRPTPAPKPQDGPGQSDHTDLHVHFCTPKEKEVVAHVASPRGNGVNSQSAGSTPFRASPAEDLSHSEEEEGGSSYCTSDIRSDDTPETQMRQLVVPVLEKTIEEMQPSPNECLPRLAPSGKDRFLAHHAATPSGAIHLTPAAIPSPAGTRDIQLDDNAFLAAMSPRSDSSKSVDSTAVEDCGTPRQLDFEQSIPDFAFAAQEKQGCPPTPALGAPQSPAEKTPKTHTPGVNLHDNDLFDLTPSPVPATRQEYTPISKQPASARVIPPISTAKQAEAGDAASCMSPEILGTMETTQAAGWRPPQTPVTGMRLHAASHPSPLGRPSLPAASLPPTATPAKEAFPKTPKSAIRNRSAMEPLSLSKPLRMSASRPRVGRNELKGLGGNHSAEMDQLGSVAALSPMRAPPRLRGTLGADEVVVTPVRRSARKSTAPPAAASSVLRQSRYSFLPNAALEARLGKEAAIGPPETFKDFVKEQDAVTEDLAALNVEDPAATEDTTTEQSTACQDIRSLLFQEDSTTEGPCETASRGGTGEARSTAATSSRRLTRSAVRKLAKLTMSPTEQDIRDSLRCNAKHHPAL